MENNKKNWISVDEKLPKVENYYHVRFENGDEDEKPFRIRPSKNIFGFMAEMNVTHWAVIDNDEEIDDSEIGRGFDDNN